MEQLMQKDKATLSQNLAKRYSYMKRELGEKRAQKIFLGDKAAMLRVNLDPQERKEVLTSYQQAELDLFNKIVPGKWEELLARKRPVELYTPKTMETLESRALDMQLE
jgi:hypothetical protein